MSRHYISVQLQMAMLALSSGTWSAKQFECCRFQTVTAFLVLVFAGPAENS